jgi:hypothetical protein
MTSLPAAPATMTLVEVPPRGAPSVAVTVAAPAAVATDPTAHAGAPVAADHKVTIGGSTRGQTVRSGLREAERSAMASGVAPC